MTKARTLADFNTTSIPASAITDLPSGGITMADQWNMTTTFTGSAEPIASNWEQNDEASFSALGSPMTEASGVFTFPSTGIYHVIFNVGTEANVLSSDMFEAVIQVSVDGGSNWDSGSIGQLSQTNISGGHGQSTSVGQIIDVTNTSNVKVRFEVSNASSNVYIQGSSSVRKTFATFIRLGDT